MTKFNDIDGARVTLQWNILYDGLGNIAGICDPMLSAAGCLGNGSESLRHRRDYEHNSLGQLVAVRDPNAGAIRYWYDENGSLARKVDALNRELRYAYSSGQRLSEITVRSTDAAQAPYQYRFRYDQPNALTPPTGRPNLVGRLSHVEWPHGSEAYAYDEFGNIIHRTATLWDPTQSRRK
jgi:YD repeat-containing protein